GKSFLGLLVFKDPVRKGMAEIIEKTKRAGIRTVIVTGDHKGTALAIAKIIGLEAKEDEIITGEELQHMGDVELAVKSKTAKIFARISPEDKLRIAKVYQAEGEVVAMTGDGVNDAPALKAADIGVAMGSGTDVAKGAADLVILDNNFETIVAAVEEGRRILGNLKKVIIYLLSDSLNQLFLIGGAIITGVPLPLNALQILWVNFFTDSFPAIAFAFEEGGDQLKKDARSGNTIFDSQMKFLILVIGTVTSALLFAIYYVLLRAGFEENLVRSFIFATFASYTLFLAFALRHLRTSIFRYNPFANPYLTGGVAFGILLTLGALYLPPLQNILGTTPLPPVWLLGVLAFSVLNILAVETAKFFFKKT
ncbi:MAG: HAD-IC family P-type ATPase, partial [Nanoarchaeota archaeon]|nr:HAD-IC family P-type ATPase [Nanoarchaeota archaeon]